MPISITVPVPRGGSAGWDTLDDNFEELQSFVNSLASQIFAVSGDGPLLLLDLFDRPGIVGPHSYVLDIDSYAGGAEIVIGRRPAPDILKGELDISVAFGIFGGSPKRVQQPGDVTLDAAAIITGLPKTIYVGVGSSGTAQLFEDTVTTGILYIYSMTWDGFNLSDFTRKGHFLPAYSLLQAISKRTKDVSIYDNETQWTGDPSADVRLPLHGAAGSNGIDGLDEGAEIVAGYVDVPRGGPGKFYAPLGTDNKLVLRFMLNGQQINLDDIEIDVSNAPDRVYFAIDVDALGLDRFVVDVDSITIERISIGADVVSARGCTYGLFVRPIVGIQIPKDGDSVDQI